MNILSKMLLVLALCGAVGVGEKDADACGGCCSPSGGQTGTEITETEPGTKG